MSFLPNWGFRNTVHAYHSKDSVKLPLKSASTVDKADGTNFIPFAEFIKQNVPEVAQDYKYWLKPWLFNGDLQSLYTSKADFTKVYKVFYGRELMDIDEHIASNYENLPTGQITADYVMNPLESTKEEFQAKYDETLPEGYPKLHPRTRYLTADELSGLHKQWGDNDKPILIIQHGLAGGSHEPAIRAVCENLFKDGVNVVVLNSRGCCRSKITTPVLYTGLHTDDLRYFVKRLHKMYPNKQLHLAGFSFGGLLIANYLAEEGENSIISSGVSVGAPWDLCAATLAITRSFAGKYLFEPALRFYLMNMMKVNKDVLKENPEFFEEDDFNNFKKTIKNTREFDEKYTSRLAGMPSATTYYLAASPIIRIFKIKTPMLVINSKDDPMICTDYPVAEVRKNPYLYMATCDLGGHYAFIDTKGEFWFNNVIKKFIRSFRETIDKDKKVQDGGYHVESKMFNNKLHLY